MHLNDSRLRAERTPRSEAICSTAFSKGCQRQGLLVNTSTEPATTTRLRSFSKTQLAENRRNRVSGGDRVSAIPLML